MKKRLCILFFFAALVACRPVSEIDPYEGSLQELAVETLFQDETGDVQHFSGINVKVENISTNAVYTSATKEDGRTSITVPNGIYRVVASFLKDEFVFNGTSDNLKVVGKPVSVSINLKRSKAGAIVIKELYCGGCKKLPIEGDYQADKYMILHNNSGAVAYLDSLCFGVISPYNSTASNPWVKQDPATGETIFQDFAPVIQAVWQFPGTGQDFPLQPGEDAVVCLSGAIDHSVQYPLSVNLNNPDYFVCYNSTYFTNTQYHPAPGDRILADHILEVVIKVGIANAYTVSINSPAMVLFRSKGMTIQDFVKNDSNLVQVPGNTVDKVVAVPWDWVMDAVEVFTASTNNIKRLSPEADAGYVVLSDTYLGHTLHRYVDEDGSRACGYELLVDTNNSGNDFYERQTQSLHE